ncbi:MAG TPA: hypothetical protein VF721_03930 [Pyrinomonadaceae bacterium]|jgi:hypothetical protein
MKKLLLTIFFIFGLSGLISAQAVFESKTFEFSIAKPANWYLRENVRLRDALKDVELTDENLYGVLKTFEGALLVAFQKYDPQTETGVNPIIQVNIRPKPTKDFRVFKEALIKNSESLFKNLKDYKMVEPPREVEISGIKSVFFALTFKYNAKDGTEMTVRSRTYAVPYKNYFFQINFNDGSRGQRNEDASKEFDELLKTIKIGRN